MAGIDLSQVAGSAAGHTADHTTGHAADLTLTELARRSEDAATGQGEPIDPAWLRRVTALIERLQRLRWRYTDGTTGRGRAPMGLVNATGCSSVWGSTFPFNPYPFPWANHLFQDSPSLAMGAFEGHMVKMAEGFKAVREAELELAGEYREQRDQAFFSAFDWRQFSDQEYALCPPLAVVGGDGAMYDIGFQNLSRALMAGKPLKVLVLDTQVYSNTGGQACTSGFLAQISDMAAFGAASQGKQEVRKELGLIGIAHRTAYVMQSTMAYPSHMIEGFIEGLNSRRPALFNCYTSCQPEHGIADDKGYAQAKLAVESRAYPLFRYDPDRGPTIAECLDLGGNPAATADWPSYTLGYRKFDRNHELELPLTFADFAATEGRFRKHFRTVPAEAWHDDMLPLADYLTLTADEREGKLPFIWNVTPEGALGRLAVAPALVASAADRRDFWALLRGLAKPPGEPQQAREALVESIRRELIDKLAGSLYQLIGGQESAPSAAPSAGPGTAAAAAEAAAAEAGAGTAGDGGEYLAPWIDTDECTACDECIQVNPEIFQYNKAHKAVITNPAGGPYQDLVKAAERCTVRVIHPGLPADPSAPELVRWVGRGRKYN